MEALGKLPFEKQSEGNRSIPPESIISHCRHAALHHDCLGALRYSLCGMHRDWYRYRGGSTVTETPPVLCV